MTALWRVGTGAGPRWARGPVDSGPAELLAPEVSLAGLLAPGSAGLASLEDLPGDGPVRSGAVALAPVDVQEVWGVGVTYRRSVVASGDDETPGYYRRVYKADRPELFFKTTASRVRGPGEPVTVRQDSSWNVPEPELAVVATAEGEVAGYVIGNDVSSLGLERENPLYLAYAKSYTGSCALGPCILPADRAGPLAELEVTQEVTRGGQVEFTGRASLARLKAAPRVYVNWLYGALQFPAGAVLLTGTGIVPPRDFTLQPGDQVTITIGGLGSLHNPVELLPVDVPRGQDRV